VLITGGRTLGRVLADKAQRLAGRPFLTVEGSDGRTVAWTWAAFDRDVNRAAHFLLAHGVRPGDKINLHLGNRPEFLVLWLAAARIGAVIVPTSPASTADEMEYVVGHSEARLAVTEPSCAAAVHAAAKGLPRLTQVLDVGARPEGAEALAWCAGMPAADPGVTVSAADEMSMQYTSGTTSRPKGVLLTHANYVYGGEAMVKAMRVGPDDRHLVVLPLTPSCPCCWWAEAWP
jgi:carnitine-CoA ligase